MPTYHTRPMPQGWSKPRDLAKLAEMRAQFEFEIPLGDLPGLPEEFAHADEPVQVRLQFGLEGGQAVVQVGLHAVLKPRCQRCLGELRLTIRADSRVAVVDSEAQAEAVPEELETFLAPGGHCSLAALAAEELLLALPLVPRHAPGERCVDAAAGADAPAPASPGATAAIEARQRPFAQLRTLLERGKN